MYACHCHVSPLMPVHSIFSESFVLSAVNAIDVPDAVSVPSVCGANTSLVVLLTFFKAYKRQYVATAEPSFLLPEIIMKN